MSSTSPALRLNRLQDATSPYLLQHAANPVDWHEWGPEALQLARREGKPIFLSIGYSACHWCHVMAHESFEDAAVASVMNTLFVNIKVDREERPDLDDIYMQATLAISGGGGWPMSVWLTPDLKPFFAGTYFPPRAQYGRMGFRELCERIGELWRTQRGALESDADKLAELVRGALNNPAAPSERATLSDLDAYLDRVSGAFDWQNGGVSGGGPNKFPPSMLLELLMRAAARNGLQSQSGRRQMEFVELTLERIAAGGVYDQLGGGIHRYSTDPEWHVPHFEKMLYDQALVSRAYLSAFALTRKPLYARVAREICDYVLADLQSPQGGFYSTRDADSEGEEGRYFVWTRAEVLDALGPREGELFCSYYDVSATGNWQDPHAPGVPKNVLRALRPLDTVAKLHRVDGAELEHILSQGRRKLLDVRSRRVAPGLDDKILVEWNGLMIAALARAGALLNEPRYLDAARRAADFVLTQQLRSGRLLRAARGARRLEMAFLSDYACLLESLLDLYEATFERRWFDAAVMLNEAAIRHYGDEAAGAFYFTADDHEQLLTRAKDLRDSATPSGNSTQLMNLLRLAAMRGDADLRARAERMVATMAPAALQAYGAADRFLAALEFALIGPVEVAIVGDRGDPRAQALIRIAQEAYLPNRVLMSLEPARPAEAPDSPLLANRPLVNAAPAAYVCRNYACRTPVTAATALADQLATAGASRADP